MREKGDEKKYSPSVLAESFLPLPHFDIMLNYKDIMRCLEAEIHCKDDNRFSMVTILETNQLSA